MVESRRVDGDGDGASIQTTEEGGAQAKEYLVKNFTDRVRNYSTVWLGATMGCCQCHDHKFDPLATREFYNMAAFFADVQEAPIGRREAGMPVPTPSQQDELKKLDDAIAAAKAKFDRDTPELEQHRPSRRVDQVAADRQLHHRTVRFGN